jgi:hypothetical protein
MLLSSDLHRIVLRTVTASKIAAGDQTVDCLNNRSCVAIELI